MLDLCLRWHTVDVRESRSVYGRMPLSWGLVAVDNVPYLRENLNRNRTRITSPIPMALEMIPAANISPVLIVCVAVGETAWLEEGDAWSVLLVSD